MIKSKSTHSNLLVKCCPIGCSICMFYYSWTDDLLNRWLLSYNLDNKHFERDAIDIIHVLKWRL